MTTYMIPIRYMATFLFLLFVLPACSSFKKTQIGEYDYRQYANKDESFASAPHAPAPAGNTAEIMLAAKNRALLRKYADILSVSPDSLNINLYGFIEDWLHTPYKWGGIDKAGIDCSAFIRCLFLGVYGLQLPRTSLEQLLTQRVEKFSSTKYLAEGDILFFRTAKGKLVSHVGFYLRNNKFINSSSHKGVVIYSFDAYWKKRFVIAARVRVAEAKKSLDDKPMKNRNKRQKN